MDRKVLARVPEHLKEPGRIWPAEQAGKMLHDLLALLEGFAGKVARPIDPYGWLWYSRRLHPAIFEGEISSTGPVDWLIFEMLGARSRRSSPPSFPATSDRGIYPIDDDTLRAVRSVSRRSRSATARRR